MPTHAANANELQPTPDTLLDVPIWSSDLP